MMVLMETPALQGAMRRIKNPAWTLILEEDRLIAHAGADSLYLIDELNAAEARALYEAWHGDSLDTLADAAIVRVLEQFRQMGALVPGQAPASHLRVAIRGHGAVNPILNAFHRLLEGESGVSVVNGEA